MSASRARRIESVVEAVGDTPLLRLRVVTKDAPDVPVYAKLEFQNPGGSVKDRAALRMIQDALKDGRLTRGKTLIDSTSGNTGVAYSLFGAALGIPVKLVMPSNVSKARKDIARAFGTEIIYSDPLEGSDGAIVIAKQMAAEDPEHLFYPDQYANPSNPLAHYLGTGPEILRDVGDQITHFVAGLGTSGTMMGTARRLIIAPFAASPSSPTRRCTVSRGSSTWPRASCPPSTTRARTTSSSPSPPRTAGTWPIASRAKRACMSVTRRARTSSAR